MITMLLSNDGIQPSIPLGTEDGTNDGVLNGELDGILLGADIGTVDSNIIESNDGLSFRPSTGV